MRPPGTNQYPWAGLLSRLPNSICCWLLRTIKSMEINGVLAITVLKVSIGSMTIFLYSVVSILKPYFENLP
jgi:hypothetical protein